MEQLDPMQHSSAILGDEQVFDIELDRHTELLPAREGVGEVAWDNAQFSDLGSGRDAEQIAEDEEEEEPEPGEFISCAPGDMHESNCSTEYAVKLRLLLPRYPMTAKGE